MSTLLEDIIRLDTRGLTEVHLTTDPALNSQLISKAGAVRLRENSVSVYIDQNKVKSLLESSEFDKVLPEEEQQENEATGFEITEEDWKNLHSIDSGHFDSVDSLSIDWLKKAGLVEESQGAIKLTKTAQSWISHEISHEEER